MRIVIDTETTGIDPQVDEILQLSILDGDNGKVLFNECFRPQHHETWPEAENVNHISPAMVQDKPAFTSRASMIQDIINQTEEIIGYNTIFDVDMLRNSEISIPNSIYLIDVMRLFAKFYGEWSEKYQDYKWKKLSECAAYYHYDWGGEHAHDGAADCRATLYCYQQILKTDSNEKLRVLLDMMKKPPYLEPEEARNMLYEIQLLVSSIKTDQNENREELGEVLEYVFGLSQNTGISKTLDIQGNEIHVDESISDIVECANKKGLPTIASCSGLPSEHESAKFGTPAAYIVFRWSEALFERSRIEFENIPKISVQEDNCYFQRGICVRLESEDEDELKTLWDQIRQKIC